MIKATKMFSKKNDMMITNPIKNKALRGCALAVDPSSTPMVRSYDD